MVKETEGSHGSTDTTRLGPRVTTSLSLISLVCLSVISASCDDETAPSTETVAGEVGGGEATAGEVSAGETAAGEVGGGETAAGAVSDGGTAAGEVSAGEPLAGSSGGSSDMFCTPGVSTECISETARSVCDETGFQYDTVPCPEGEFCLRGECGQQRCDPGTTRCLPEDPTSVFVCDPTGERWVVDAACEQGLACQDGACMSRCEAAAKLNTYIGCEYWTVDLDNYPDPFTVPMPNEVPHSVVIANPGNQTAVVRFETRAGVTISPAEGEVQPGEARAFTMPRLDVDNTSITDHSIKVSSSMPVVAYQFNPLNNDNVFSNDASLLLPVNTLGRSYLVSSWPTGINTENIAPLDVVPQAGYFTVVAVAPGETEVTVTVSADTVAGPDVPAMVAGETATFTLSQYDVLNLQAESFTPADFFELIGATPHDLTGSLVESTQRVAVFGGHEEAVISYTSSGEESTCCADHLEEQLLPLNTWSPEALCVKAKPRSASGEKDIWRVISGEDGNVITSNPPVTGLNGITLNRGEWVQVESELSFSVTGTGPLQATQYLISQGQTDQGTGDPSMILAVPTRQYRSEYTILVPVGYGSDWVTVIRPAGLAVYLDGAEVMEPFEAFADGAWERAYVPVDPGSHTFDAAQPFGLVAYGWNNAVSYGYPAGLNLGSADQGERP